MKMTNYHEEDAVN